MRHSPRLVSFALPLAALGLAPASAAYPIDGYENTGIPRLEAYRLVQDGQMPGRILPWGSQLYTKEIALRLADRPGFAIPAPDPELTARLRSFLGADASRYGVALLDLSDPAHPRYAAHQADMPQNPGSVGKLLVALGWFQALADAFPDDVEARRRLLKDVHVSASEVIRNDHHDVVFWKPGEPRYEIRPIEIGDVGNLYTWLDWMLSNSSNAAAATLQAQLMLFRHFGKDHYPVPAEEAERFFRTTPKAELARLLQRSLTAPVERNGLDPAQLRQGSFFTRTGKTLVPGGTSVATAGELLRWMVQMERGLLVDSWSSLELKKLLYLTDRRVRYAGSAKLWNYAVYFKSGSLYECRPEKGFVCERYHGNVRNFMNSVTMIEGVDEHKGLHYIAVVLSDVLRRNSAQDHRRLGEEIHALLVSDFEARQPPAPSEAARPADATASPQSAGE